MSALKASFASQFRLTLPLLFLLPPSAFATLQKEEDVPVTSPVINLKVRKTLKGHRGRILHFDWSPDKYHIVTAGQVCMSVCMKGI